MLIQLNRAYEMLADVRLNLNVKEVPTSNSSGMICCEDLTSPQDIPWISKSAMDGYAVNSLGLKKYKKLKIIGRAYPWSPPSSIRDFETVYVSTGSSLPEGADAVLRKEYAKVDGEYVISTEEVESGKDVIQKADDFHAGESVVTKGEIIRPYHLGALYAIGAERVRVCDIKMGFVAIGTELVPFYESVGVRDSISPILISLVSSFTSSKYYGTLPDSMEEIQDTMIKGTEENDILITIGGTSVGERDFTKRAAEKVGKILFEGVTVNMIKHTSVAIVNDKPVVMLPGQPVAAVLAFHVFVLEILSNALKRKLYREETARLANDLEVQHKMDSIYPALTKGEEVTPLRWGTALYSQLIKANSYVILSRGSHKRGEEVVVRYFL
ncbi:molybdopterin molybdenumtransferase MoeA [Sulfolobales archaeon HS-7]|nr:molybdopterin molybdenumtransferase MoeA [Sulfolobales archaeon HS-7]